MQPLRADTVTEVTIGPAVAVGDGFTPVTTLTIAGADEAEIIKHGATTTTAIGGTLAAITSADGYYALDLLTGEVDTEGRLTILINDDSLILPIRQDFVVLTQEVFDDLYGSSAVGYLKPVVAGNDLDVTATGAAGVDWANVEGQTTAVDLSATDFQLVDTVTTLTGHTNQTGDSFAVVNSGSFGNAQLVRSTTPANTLDVAATGEAGVDLGNVTGTLGNANVGWVDGSNRVDVGSVLGTAQTAGDIMASLGEGNAAAAAGDPSATESVMQYVKQLVNVIIGTAGVGAMPTALDPANGVNLFEMLRAAMGSTFATATDSLEQLQIDLVSVQSDTDDLQTQIGTAGAGLSDLGGMSTGMKAEVLVEVNAALDTALSELAQAAPTATPTLRTGLMLLYMALRNRLDTQTSATDALEIYNNAGTRIAQKLITDDGADYSEAQMISGV